MKKLFAVILAVALMATMSVTAFAMQVFIEITVATGSESIPLEVEPTDKIEDVKAKIFDKNGTPIALQVLTFAGKTLEDGHILQDYSISKDSIIHLSAMASTTVAFHVDPTYTVTIPATVELDKTTAQDGTVTYEKDYTITAADVRLKKGEYIEVAVASDFEMNTQEGATLGYTITAGGNAVANNGVVAEFGIDKLEQTATIHIAANDPEFAGEYKDTVTFTVSLEGPMIINFTLDTIAIAEWVPGLTQNLQAEAGMTWGEWVESAYNVDGYIVYPLHWIDFDCVGPNADWAITNSQATDDYVSLTDEIIAGYNYSFNITGG